MARTVAIAASKMDDTPELSELLAPFMKGNDLEGQLTPYRVTVLVLLEQYVTYGRFDEDDSNDFASDDFTNVEKRKIAVAFLKLFRSVSKPFGELRTIVYEEFGAPILAHIFYILSRRAADMNLDLFLSMVYGCIARIIYGDAKPSIKSTSMAGQFVRKLFVCYKKCSFDDLYRLWIDFRGYFRHVSIAAPEPFRRVRFREQTPAYLVFMDADSTRSNVDSEINADENREPTRSVLNTRRNESTRDEENDSIGEKFGFGGSIKRKPPPSTIPSQKEALGFILKQIHLFEYDSAKALSYGAMRGWIEETRRLLPYLHELHFLEYLNELRIKNLPRAEAALHIYIDCAGLTLINKHVLNSASVSNRLGAPATVGIPMGAFRSLRYGPLLLADMHRRFGSEDKAVAYLQECVKNAEEANDKICLDYAVALFSMLHCAGKRSDYQRLVDQALKDTEDRNAASLHFRCHLSQLTKNIGECKNEKILLEIKHSIIAEVSDKVSAVVTNGKDRALTERSIKNLVRVAFSSAYLQRGYWNAACLEAQKLVYSTTLKTTDVSSLAVTNLAYALAAKGEYSKGKSILLDFKSHFAKCSKEFDRLHLAESIVGFESAFLVGDASECERNLSIMAALSPIEAEFRRAIYGAARNKHNESINSMMEFLNSDSEKPPYLRCRTLLILGRLLLHGTGKIGIAQEYLTRCMNLAEEFHFPHLIAMAAVDLMEVKVALGIQSDLDDLREMSQASAVDSISMNLSKARITLKAAADSKGARRCIEILESITSALDSINGKIYQRQACALLGLAHQILGNTESRNRISKLYRQLNESLVASGFTALVF